MGNIPVKVFTDCQCTYVGKYIEGLLVVCENPLSLCCYSRATQRSARPLLYKDPYSGLAKYYILGEAREKNVMLHIFLRLKNYVLDICMSTTCLPLGHEWIWGMCESGTCVCLDLCVAYSPLYLYLCSS